MPKTAEKISTIATLDEMKTFVKASSITGLGVKAKAEILDAIENLLQQQERETEDAWHNADKIPPLGVPLMVKTYDSTTEMESVKYPVYLCKSPYDLKEEWYFFPACEGICKLLPEYSRVIAWKVVKK